MPRAQKTCSTPSCPEIVASGRCEDCKRDAERQRGTASQRGYGHKHRTGFRAAVLRRDPICRCTDDHRDHCGGLAASTVADHHPHSRRDLVALGLDPNNPNHGRGLCTTCHGWWTSQERPGGWHAR